MSLDIFVHVYTNIMCIPIYTTIQFYFVFFCLTGGSAGRGRGGPDHGRGASSRGGRGRGGGRGGSAPPGARGGRKPQLTKQNSSELANEEWETALESSDVLTQDHNHDKESKNDLKDKESKKDSNNAAPHTEKFLSAREAQRPVRLAVVRPGKAAMRAALKQTLL